MVKIYPEVDVAVNVMDPKTEDTVHFTGRADWAFGYSGRQRGVHGTSLWRQRGADCLRLLNPSC